MTPNYAQSGVILKSPIWTFGEVKRTQSTLNTSTLLEASITRRVSQPVSPDFAVAQTELFSAGETP